MRKILIKIINFKLFCLLNITLLNYYNNVIAIEEVFQESSTEDFADTIEFDSSEEAEINYLPQEPILVDNQEVKIGLTINFPVIGDIVLYPEKDASGKEVLKATLSEKSIKLDLIGMTIDNFTIVISDNKMPKVSADVTLFGQKATLELVELKKASNIIKEPVTETKYNKLSLPIEMADFRIAFIDKPLLELLPLRNLNLNYVDLIIKKDAKPALSTNINILGVDVKLSLSYDKDKGSFFEFLLPKITLGNFFSELKDSQFNNVVINDLLIKSSINPKNKGLENQKAYNFSGSLDFSPINLPGIENIPISLNKMNITGSYSKTNGLEINSGLSNFKIAESLQIEEGKFLFYSKRAIKAKIEEIKNKLANNKDLALESLEKHELKLLTIIGKEDKPLILINGLGNVNLPGIGKLDFHLTADYSSKGLEIKGIFNQPINYGGIKINNAEFTLNTETHSLLITGDSDFQGLKLTVKLQVSQDQKDPNNKIYKVEALTESKNWQPFKNQNLPEFLKNIDIKNLSVSIDASTSKNNQMEAKFILNGDIEIMNVLLKSQIMAIKSGDNKGLLLKAEAKSAQLPAGLNKLPIEKSYFIATTIEYKDIENNLTYGPNSLTLVGKVNLTGILEPIGKIIGNKESTFDITGNLNPAKIDESKLSIKLSQGIPLKTKVVSIGPVSIDIGLKNNIPVISLNTYLTLHPDSNDLNKELNFTGIAGVSPTEISGELRLDGMWHNPFGLKSIEIGDLDVALGINPVTFPTTLIPSKLDLGGRLELAPDKIITLAIAINYLANQVAFLGSLESKDPNRPGNLSLKDIVDFIANRLDAKVPTDKVPVMEVQEPKLSFASQNTQVGAIKIPMGITVNGKLNLLSQAFDITFSVSTSGVAAKAAMTPVTLGPLKLTAGKTATGEIRKTKYNGPEVDIELTLERQIFLISCLLELDSIVSGSGDMEVSKNGINFNFEALVGPDKYFSAILQGQSTGALTNPGFNFKILMKQQFINFAKEAISKELKKYEANLRKKIEGAITEIKKIDTAIETHKKDLENARSDVKKAQDELSALDRASKEATTEIDKWKSDVNKLQNQINTITSNIDKLKNTKLSTWDVVGKVKKEGKIKLLQGEKLALQASMKIANGTLENLFKKAATGTLKISKDIANKTLNVAKNFLNEIQAVDVKVLEESRDISMNILKIANASGVGVLEGANFMFRNILTEFNITEFKLESSLDKVKNGELFDVSIDMHLLGKDRNFKGKFNLKDIKNSINKVAQEIVSKLIPNIIKL